MDLHEWNEVLKWMTMRWDGVKRWSLDRERAYYEDLDAYPQQHVFEVVKRKYEAGERYPPTGGQILAALRESGATQERRGPHKHVWAILEYEDQRPDNLRFAMCALPECHEERLSAPETLRTAGGA